MHFVPGAAAGGGTDAAEVLVAAVERAGAGAVRGTGGWDGAPDTAEVGIADAEDDAEEGDDAVDGDELDALAELDELDGKGLDVEADVLETATLADVFAELSLSPPPHPVRAEMATGIRASDERMRRAFRAGPDAPGDRSTLPVSAFPR